MSLERAKRTIRIWLCSVGYIVYLVIEGVLLILMGYVLLTTQWFLCYNPDL